MSVLYNCNLLYHVLLSMVW